MRDLSVTEIDRVSGGTFSEFLAGFGEVTVHCWEALAGSPRVLTLTQQQQIQSHVEGGGTAVLTATGESVQVTFQPATGGPGRISFSSPTGVMTFVRNAR